MGSISSLIGTPMSSNFCVRTNRFRIENLLCFSTTSSNNKNNIIPEVVYTNTDTQKLDILRDNKSGIYR